jgi:asparagine synthase (glutamine-hydrolysing)
MFDVLRSDRSISSHGLEARTPFLDKQFVAVALSLDTRLRRPEMGRQCEKWILREAFDESGLLPKDVLWRKKEAFSDGVSNHGRSLFTIIQERICEQLCANNPYSKYIPSIEIEKAYYKDIFDKAYPNCAHILPYFWMPKYTNATDPSARTLTFYNADSPSV